MATLNIELPAIMKITNTGASAQSFQPYHENFNVGIPAGVSVEFEVMTAGQYFYYMKQAKENLVVEKIAEFDVASETITVIDVPATITLTNISNRIKTFQPYHENFSVEMQAGDVINLEATTVGQVLYYVAQRDSDLSVAHTPKVSN